MIEFTQEEQDLRLRGEAEYVKNVPNEYRGSDVVEAPQTQGDASVASFDDDEYLDLTALPEPKPIKGDWLGAALTGLDAIASEEVDQ